MVIFLGAGAATRSISSSNSRSPIRPARTTNAQPESFPLRNAGYIVSRIGLLKADTGAFFAACTKAQVAGAINAALPSAIGNDHWQRDGGTHTPKIFACRSTESRASLRDRPTDWRDHRSVLCRSCVRWLVKRRLVLVVMQTRRGTGVATYRAIRYQLLGLQGRIDHSGIASIATIRLHCSGSASAVNLQ